MRSSWAQPSLSRDFMLLSAAVIFVLMLVSSWITYRTYEKQAQHITTELEKEAQRIDSSIATHMGNANYMLSSLGRQIIIDPNRDFTKLAQSLKSFDSKNSIYSLFSWISTDKKMMVSSNKGVLEEPVDLSDRDFIQEAAVDSWKMHIGKPIEGRVSNRWVIPVAMGITDYTGKFIGIIALSIDIEVLTGQITNLVKRDGISFAIVSRGQLANDSKDYNKNLTILTEVADSKDFIKNNFPLQRFAGLDLEKEPKGLVTRGSLLMGAGAYSYYLVSNNFPYIVMMVYDANFSDETVRTILLSRLLQIFMVAIFFVVFLWIVRLRVISPVMDITEAVASIAKGNKFTSLRKKGQVELEALVAQVHQVSKYIDENKRIENELRNKMFMLKKAKENSDINIRSKSEFMAYIAQEIRMPVNNIIGFSQVLKDQIYGSIENRKYKQYATDIFVIANQLIEKIQDIITHSKIETGNIDLEEKPLNIAALVNSALRYLENKLSSRKITVKTDIPENFPYLLADEFRMHQVVTNLVSLVIDQIEQDGVISVNTAVITEQADKQFFIMNISDTKYVATKLEKPCSAMWEEGSSKYSDNIDLRFELVKALVELHGGVLSIRSVGNGENHFIYSVIFSDSRLINGD